MRQTKPREYKNLSPVIQGILSSNEVLTVDRIKSLDTEDTLAIKTLTLHSGWFMAQHVLRPVSKKYLPLADCHKRMHAFLPVPSDGPLSEWRSLSNPDLPIQERVLLGFRSLAKSSAVVVPHLVQVILNCPDVRIRLVSGSLDSGTSQVRQVRDALNTNEILQYFFPEFCDIPSGGDGKSFVIPTRMDLSLRDDTLRCTSFRANSTGGRCDYLVLDDAATSLNQASLSAQEKSWGSYEDLQPLVEPDGLGVLYVGTRWGLDDLPAQIEKHSNEHEQATGETTLDWLEVPVYEIKTGQRNQNEIDRRNAEHRLNMRTDVDLTWAEHMPADAVQSRYRQSNFDSQYLLKVNAVSDYRNVRISNELFESCVSSKPPVATSHDIAVMNLDTANPDSGEDKWCLVSGIWNPATQTLHVLTMILDKVRDNPKDDAISTDDFFAAVEQTYNFLSDGNPNRVKFRGENACAAKALFGGRLFQRGIEVFWQNPNNQADARSKRVLSLANAMLSQRVHFSDKIATLDELRGQMTSYDASSSKRTHHQDGLDSVAQLYEYCLTLDAPEEIPIAEVVDRDTRRIASETFERNDYYQDANLIQQVEERNQQSAAQWANETLNPYGEMRGH